MFNKLSRKYYTILSEVKNTLHGISSTLAFVEEKINVLKAWQ